MTHRITLERNTLRFAAAHFASLEVGCEPLHGHTYEVTIELDGSLTGPSWVMDFAAVKRIGADICKQVDHRFILPLGCPTLRFADLGSEYEISCADRRYVIPKSDVAALPIDNSTAERIAEWFAGRLRDELQRAGVANVTRITVGIEESPGQAGWYSVALATLQGRSNS